MIVVTVTLNPSIDYVTVPSRFQAGSINRYSVSSYGPGGKGVNVSMLLASLGIENWALGVAAGFSGREAVRLLEQSGCKTDFFFLPEGHSRINIKVCVPGGEETELNGEGPFVPLEAVEWLEKRLSILGEDDFLVLAGSVPPSLPRNTYALLLEKAGKTGVKSVVDASGEALLATLPYKPFLIKPNLEELGELFGTAIEDVGGAREYAGRLQNMGARNVIVSMGEKGALLLKETGETLFCHAVRGEAVSTVGAGDSLVAGFLYGLNLHGTLEGGLRWGIAAGAATSFQKGIASGADVKGLYPQVGNPHLL